MEATGGAQSSGQKLAARAPAAAGAISGGSAGESADDELKALRAKVKELEFAREKEKLSVQVCPRLHLVAENCFRENFHINC